MGSRIKAISYHLPETIFTNEQFYDLFPEAKENETSYKKIGISERRIVSSSETASDLAVKAAEKLFTEHHIDKQDIDFVLFCAQEFDYYTPTTACIIQHRLGLSQQCGALDFNLGCSGFVYGLSMAKAFIESLGCKNVLLLTASTLTKTFHSKDKTARFLFGDGAAATLISKDDTSAIGEFIFGTDGSEADAIMIKDGGARNNLIEQSFIDVTDEFGNTTNDASFKMNGSSIFYFGLETVPELIQQTVSKNTIAIHDIDGIVFHQANAFLIESIAKKTQIPLHKVFNYMETVGNTVSSTIPIVLHDITKNNKLKTGNKILICGFGTGLSWAATVITL